LTHSDSNGRNLDKNRDDLIFDLIRKRFDNERERTNNLDGKAHNLVGYTSVVVGLLLGGGSLLSGGEIFKSSTFLSNSSFAVIYFIGVSLLLISIGFALTALKIRRWSVVPNVQTLINDYTLLSYSEVLQRNAGEMAKAVVNSEEKNNNKAKSVEWSWYFLIAGLSIVFTSVILFTASIGR
jgi:hypothetical protein